MRWQPDGPLAHRGWHEAGAGASMFVGLAATFAVAGATGGDVADALGVAAAVVLAIALVATRWIGLGRAAAYAAAASGPLGAVAFFLLCAPVNAAVTELDAIGGAFLALSGFTLAFGTTWLVVRGIARIPGSLVCAAARITAVALIAVSAVVLVLSARRHSSCPPFRAAHAALEHVGCFAGGDEKGVWSPRDRLVAGGLALAMRVDPRRGCVVRILEGDHQTGAFTYVPSVGKGAFDRETCAHTCVDRFASESVWIASYSDKLGPADAQGFVAPSFRAHGVGYDSFARNFAPPLTWILWALGGTSVALLALLPRDRRLRALLGWREETVDGATTLVPPVEGEPGYRDFGRPPLLVRTSLAEVRARLLARRTGRWAFAVAAIVVTGAPLGVAAALGFVV